MKPMTGITVALTTALLLGLYGTTVLANPPSATRTKTIKVKIDDPKDPPNAKLEITSRKTDHGCTAADNPGRGCIKVDQGQAADMVFDLRGKPKCSDSDYWMLTAVQLGGYNSDTKPGPSEWGNLPDNVVSDFGADKTTGEARATMLDKERIRIHDKNQTKYDIWYRLKAECGSFDPIYSDPRIRNTGN